MTAFKKEPNYDLKWLREYAGFRQQKAAEVLRVNRVTYANWERGETPTPPKVLILFAAAIGCDVSIIPENLAEITKQEAEASAFAKEVKTLMGKPNVLTVESVAPGAGYDSAALPSLPPIDIPLHKFLPSSMKRFNVPTERWAEFVQDKKGENSEDLRLAGYSWDQAVEWRSTEARAQAYALLKLWEQARDRHFKDRAAAAQQAKIAMPLLVYTEIVRIFDELLELHGWGLV